MDANIVLPFILVSFIIFLFATFVVGVVVIMKKNSLKKQEVNEINADLKRRVETLEKEIEEINKILSINKHP